MTQKDRHQSVHGTTCVFTLYSLYRRLIPLEVQRIRMITLFVIQYFVPIDIVHV